VAVGMGIIVPRTCSALGEAIGPVISMLGERDGDSVHLLQRLGGGVW